MLGEAFFKTSFSVLKGDFRTCIRLRRSFETTLLVTLLTKGIYLVCYKPQIDMDKSDLSDEDIDSLRTLAASDLRSAKYASKLCESFNIDSTQTTTNTQESPESLTDTPETQEKGSIFAY